MATINGSTQIRSNFAQVSATLPGSPSIMAPQSAQLVLQGNGTGQDQCDLKHSKEYTLAAAPTALDLTNLTDVDGNPVNFARVRSISVIVKDQVDSHSVLMGYATTTSNAWTSLLSNPGQIKIEPSTAVNQGAFAMTAPNATGWPVNSTNKLLNFDPGGNTVTIDVEIVGASV